MRRLSRETAQAVAIASCWGVGVAVAVMALYDVVPWRNVFESTAAAAWVQALGAICAIAAGFGVAAWQVGLNRRREIEGENARLEIVATLLFEARAEAENAKAVDRQTLDYESSCKQIAYAVAALRSIPAFEAPDWRVTHAISRAVARFEEQTAAIADAPMEVSSFNMVPRSQAMTIIYEDLSYAENVVRQVMLDRGLDVPKMAIQENGRIVRRSLSVAETEE